MRYLLILFFFIVSLNGESATLRADYPKRYTVQSGDTLWSIASRYLHAPWEWKELWHANPRIKNPNRLFPGAVLVLRFNKGKPYFRVLSNGTIKLSPGLRPMPLENAILPIPLTDIKPFLNASLVLDHDILRKAPFVVAFMGEHMLGGQGDNIYVKNLHPETTLPVGANLSYAIYREGCPYMKAGTKNLLGYKATLVGYGELMQGGNPAVLNLTVITEGVKIKDRVLPNSYPEFNLYFEPKTPLRLIQGHIIDLPPAYTQGASGLVAVIDQGKDKSLEPGDVLGVYAPAHRIPDPMCAGKSILIPRERIGEIMIFRVFSKTSFGLVVRSMRVVHLMDVVTNP